MNALALSIGAPFDGAGRSRRAAILTRCGSPRRAAILTAVAASAVCAGDLKAVLALAHLGRPRALRNNAAIRRLARAALMTVYPDANAAALTAALGRVSTVARRGQQALEVWPEETVEAVARAVIENEDARLTARWIWPRACALAAEHTGAEPREVLAVTGSRAPQPHAISKARQMAVYLTMTEGDVNATAMAAESGLDKKTVRHAVDILAARRDDDPAMEATLTRLAAALCARLDEELSQW